MDIILLERVAKLGQMGEVVSVKEGYARNFLLPQGKALRANEANIKRFESEKAQLEARNLEGKQEAEKLAEKLDGETFVVIRSASDGGSLYGSVSTRDAADAATEAGFSLDRKQEEADLQAQGKSIQELAAEEEAAAEFEIEQLFDDIGAAQLDELETEDEQRTAEPAVQEKAELDEKLGDDD